MESLLAKIETRTSPETKWNLKSFKELLAEENPSRNDLIIIANEYLKCGKIISCQVGKICG